MYIHPSLLGVRSGDEDFYCQPHSQTLCNRMGFVAVGRDGQEIGATAVGIGQARDPLAYVGAALILLAIAANEQPEMIRAASETLS